MEVVFNNQVEITVRSGVTGEVISEARHHNDISDDFCGSSQMLYMIKNASTNLNSGYPYAFILPDGAEWATFSFDRTNPWVPYAVTANRTADPVNADTMYKASQWSYDSVLRRHKLFFRWSNLVDDFNLKAVCLSGQDTNFSITSWGLVDATTALIPSTISILPSAISIKGRKLGTQTPDTLEISYFLSSVSVS